MPSYPTARDSYLRSDYAMPSDAWDAYDPEGGRDYREAEAPREPYQWPGLSMHYAAIARRAKPLAIVQGAMHTPSDAQRANHVCNPPGQPRDVPSAGVGAEAAWRAAG